MKIIAENTDTFVVIMTKDEAAQFAGAYSAYSMEDKPRVGSNIKLGDIYSSAREAIEDYEKIQKSVEELHKAAVRVITKMDIKNKEK